MANETTEEKDATTTQTIDSNGVTPTFSIQGGDNHIILQGTPGTAVVTLEISIDGTDWVSIDGDGTKIFQASATTKAAGITVADCQARFSIASAGGTSLTARIQHCARI